LYGEEFVNQSMSLAAKEAAKFSLAITSLNVIDILTPIKDL